MPFSSTAMDKGQQFVRVVGKHLVKLVLRHSRRFMVMLGYTTTVKKNGKGSVD